MKFYRHTFNTAKSALSQLSLRGSLAVSFRRLAGKIYLFATPVLLVIALGYVFFYPPATVQTEQNTQDSMIKEYPVSPDELWKIRRAFLQLRRQSLGDASIADYIEPKDPLVVSMNINRVTDLDVNNGTVYASGLLEAMWSDNSFAENDPLLAESSIAKRLNSSIKEDVVSDISFPDAILDDTFYLEKEFVDKRVSSLNKDTHVYLSRYRFGATFNFKPSLKTYPADVQDIRFIFSFNTIKPFMAKFSSKVPGLVAVDPKNLKFGSYKLMDTYEVEPFIRLPSMFDNLLLDRDFLKDPVSLFEDRIPSIVNKEGFNVKDKWDSYASIESLFSDLNATYSWGTGVVFRRITTLFMFRTLLPIDLVMLGGVMNTFVPRRMSDVRLAVPPTLLLSLVFMQQSNNAELPVITYITYIDAIYYLAYLGTVLLMAESVLVCCIQRESRRTLVTRLVRVMVLVLCILGGKIMFPVLFVD